ncbi:hypothetical protein KC723_02420 [Candidatus Kaiserbacteria bacterium]|nr:hypothetical protein [Candidatus Kaiserbacteria bacterium]
MKISHKYISIFPTITFLFCLLMFFVMPQIADAAKLSLSPGTGVYTAGGTFTVRVILNTEGQPVNAADATLSFNSSELTVVSVSRSGSIFNLWTQEPTFSNSAGTISFGGGSPTGYTGSSGTIMNVTFRAATAGTGRVSFTNGSVLAADGRGTNVLSNMNGGTYTISAVDVQPDPEVIIEYVAPANTPAKPAIKSSTHPNPDGWYKETTAKLSWTIPTGVTGVRTLLDNNAGSIPTKVYESPISSIDLDNLEDGISYFHIQFRNSEGWGKVAHYRLAVDTKNPESFEIVPVEGSDPSNPSQTFELKVKDAISPVKRFIVKVNADEPYEYIDETASGTITVGPLEPGHHTLVIEAFDSAGNSIADTHSFNIIAFGKPQFTDYPTELNEGVIPVIKGLTKPRAKVYVTLLRGGKTIAENIEVTANENGEFIFIPEESLNNGIHELTAYAVDELGAQSEVSDTIRIAVQQPGFIRIGSFIVSILSVLIPLIALLVLLTLFVWFVYMRLKRFRRKVSVESTEAFDIVKKEFSELHTILLAQEKKVAESRKTKKLTKAESELIESLTMELQDSQQRIEKEITDVTKLTK